MSYKSQTISAVVLTHNDGKVIERCLDSLRWVDDIVILDQGSTDNTLEIAKRYTQRIHFHPSSNLAERRNYAFELVKSDWVISVEPYEWVLEMLRHEIDGVLLNIPAEVNGFTVKNQFHFQNKPIGRAQIQIRLFRKGHGRALQGPFSHHIIVDGLVQRLDRPLGSEPYTNLQQWFQDLNQRSTQAAYQALETGKQASNSIWGTIFAMKWIFARHFFLGQGFQDGFCGLTVALANMFEHYLTQAKLRNLCRAKL